MVRVSTLTIGLIALSALTAEADTITTTDSRSWNGSVTAIQNGVLTLNANFYTGTQALPFGADYIRAIDFNAATYNPGESPLDPLKLLPKPVDGKLGGTIYMRDKSQPHKCADITVDSKNVLCDGQPIDRQKVLRIQVAH
jgi:hypothetical protein